MIMGRNRRLDGPLLRLEKLQKEGLVACAALSAAAAATAAGALSIMQLSDTGRIDWSITEWALSLLGMLGILGVAALAVLLSILPWDDVLEDLGLRLRVLPAARRARLDRLTPAGLLALSGKITSRDAAESADAARYARALEALRPGELARLHAAVRSRAAKDGLAEERLGLARDYLCYRGPVSDLADLLALGLEERSHLLLFERQVRTILHEAGHRNLPRLVREVLLPALAVEHDRRRSLTRLLLLIVRNDPRPEMLAGLTAQLAGALNQLDDTQHGMYRQMLPNWTGDPEALLEAARTV